MTAAEIPLFDGSILPHKAEYSCMETEGRLLNGFLGLSLNTGTILFIVIFLDKTVSVG